MNGIEAGMSSPAEARPSIVSVNSRGGASSGMAFKVAFCLLVVGLVAIGALVGVNKHRANQKQEDEKEAIAAKASADSPSSVPRRTFSSDPPPPPPTTTTPAASAVTPAAVAPTCQDGSLGQPLLGADGQAISGPTGQPLHVCAGGQIVVPAVQPMPGDLQPIPNGHQGGASPPASASAPPSRYGGDVVLPQSAASAAAGSHADPSGRLGTELSAVGLNNPVQDGARVDQPVNTASAVRNPGKYARNPDGGQQGEIGHLLNGSSAASVSATMIGDRDMIIPQGRSIDCNLSMRLVNEVSGKATCVLSSNVYSDSGRVVLAERGSTATGEYVAMMAQGQRRLFVLWTRLQTTSGVVIDINSPASDALGTSGLPGDIDNRWRDRIGAAVLLSLVEDAIGYQTAKASSADGGSGAQGIAVFQNSTQTGRGLAERILDSTINIKPTLYKNQGDRATIFVSRDLDFGRVYALRAK